MIFIIIISIIIIIIIIIILALLLSLSLLLFIFLSHFFAAKPREPTGADGGQRGPTGADRGQRGPTGTTGAIGGQRGPTGAERGPTGVGNRPPQVADPLFSFVLGPADGINGAPSPIQLEDSAREANSIKIK